MYFTLNCILQQEGLEVFGNCQDAESTNYLGEDNVATSIILENHYAIHGRDDRHY